MNTPALHRLQHRLAPWLLATAAALSMTACGGGSGGSATTNPGTDPGTDPGVDPEPVFNPIDLAGPWYSATDTNSTSAYFVNVVPGENNTSQAWVLAVENNTATRLAKAVISADHVVTGWSFDLNDDSANAQAIVNASAEADLTATPKRFSVTGISASPLVLSPGVATADAANQADAAANWRTTLRGGAVVINWSVGADGLISGASSTGCSYAGNLAAQPEIRVFKISFKESCPNLDARDLTGIATVKSDLSTLKVLATTANDAQGAALLFAK